MGPSFRFVPPSHTSPFLTFSRLLLLSQTRYLAPGACSGDSQAFDVRTGVEKLCTSRLLGVTFEACLERSPIRLLLPQASL